MAPPVCGPKYKACIIRSMYVQHTHPHVARAQDAPMPAVRFGVARPERQKVQVHA